MSASHNHGNQWHDYGIRNWTTQSWKLVYKNSHAVSQGPRNRFQIIAVGHGDKLAYIAFTSSYLYANCDLTVERVSQGAHDLTYLCSLTVVFPSNHIRIHSTWGHHNQACSCTDHCPVGRGESFQCFIPALKQNPQHSFYTVRPRKSPCK